MVFMGTRHITIVKQNKKNVVAQYGQWDGYPSGQGKTVIEFLQGLSLDTFKEQLTKTHLLKDDERAQYYKEAYESIGMKSDSEYMTQAESELFKSKFPENHRDTGAGILKVILENEKPILNLDDESEFRKDSLFCEYVHIVDLDKGVYKIYRGGSKRPLFKTDLYNPISVDGFIELCKKKKW